MKNTVVALLNDESGFIVSAELILVATLLVIGLIVGLSEIQYAVVQELNDVAESIGSLNQSYTYTGFTAVKQGGHIKSRTVGSSFNDTTDSCDNNQCQLGCDGPTSEGSKGGHHGHK
ncbi:Flp family type IVb pilin [Planctomicrobium sp. SH527]|uniref:Flp family type IVb pilin n=1 Tax=Planctomicrobium sp. SH527 TaxID=3448123 RepID=UPI003F5BEFBE